MGGDHFIFIFHSFFLIYSGARPSHSFIAEFEFVKQAMYVDPYDQSAWLYHRWLVGAGEMRACIAIATRFSIIIIINPAGEDRQVLEREIAVIEELREVEPDSKCMVSPPPLLHLPHHDLHPNLGLISPRVSGITRALQTASHQARSRGRSARERVFSHAESIGAHRPLSRPAVQRFGYVVLLASCIKPLFLIHNTHTPPAAGIREG